MIVSKALIECNSKWSPYNRPPRAKRGSRDIALLILNLGGRRGWVVSTTPRPLYPREIPGTHCTGGWVGPRAGLDVCEKSRPPPGLNAIVDNPKIVHFDLIRRLNPKI
jgi:hypothetical protein